MIVKINKSDIDKFSKWTDIFFEYRKCTEDLNHFKDYFTQYINSDDRSNCPKEWNGDFLIFFNSINGEYFNDINEIFSYQWAYYNPDKHENYVYFTCDDFIDIIKNHMGFATNKNDFISDEDFIPKIENKEVPLGIAKEMYNSNNANLRNYALMLYKEEHLKDSIYETCKTQVSASNKINMNFTINESDIWMSKLIKYLNGKVDYINSELYLPIIKVVEFCDHDTSLHGRPVAKFSYANKSYLIFSGTKSSYIPIRGIFNYDKNLKCGSASSQASNFACSTKLNAMFISKYFAKELFIASMKNTDILNQIKWYDIE